MNELHQPKKSVFQNLAVKMGKTICGLNLLLDLVYLVVVPFMDFIFIVCLLGKNPNNLMTEFITHAFFLLQVS